MTQRSELTPTHLTPAEKQVLKELAATENRSVSNFILRALDLEYDIIALGKALEEQWAMEAEQEEA